MPLQSVGDNIAITAPGMSNILLRPSEYRRYSELSMLSGIWGPVRCYRCASSLTTTGGTINDAIARAYFCVACGGGAVKVFSGDGGSYFDNIIPSNSIMPYVSQHPTYHGAGRAPQRIVVTDNVIGIKWSTYDWLSLYPLGLVIAGRCFDGGNTTLEQLGLSFGLISESVRETPRNRSITRDGWTVLPRNSFFGDVYGMPTSSSTWESFLFRNHSLSAADVAFWRASLNDGLRLIQRVVAAVDQAPYSFEPDDLATVLSIARNLGPGVLNFDSVSWRKNADELLAAFGPPEKLLRKGVKK